MACSAGSPAVCGVQVLIAVAWRRNVKAREEGLTFYPRFAVSARQPGRRPHHRDASFPLPSSPPCFYLHTLPLGARYENQPGPAFYKVEFIVHDGSNFAQQGDSHYTMMVDESRPGLLKAGTHTRAARGWRATVSITAEVGAKIECSGPRCRRQWPLWTDPQHQQPHRFCEPGQSERTDRRGKKVILQVRTHARSVNPGRRYAIAFNPMISLAGFPGACHRH